MKNHAPWLKITGWSLFGLNLSLGLLEALTNRSQATFKTLAYAYPFLLQGPKIGSVVLAFLAVLLGLAALVGRAAKKPETASRQTVIWWWLAAVGLFFLPNTVCLLNQSLDFSRPSTLPGKVTALRADYHDLAGLIAPPRGWGRLAALLSGKDYLLLRRSGAGLSDTASRGEYYWSHNELVQVVPPVPIEVYKVHRGFFGIRWQENSGGYRLPSSRVP